MSDFQRIAAFLIAVRRRLLWVHVGAGLLAGGFAAGVVLLVCGVLVLMTGPHPTWPAIAWAASAVALLGAIVVFAARPAARLRRKTDVAREVGTHAPHVSSDLLSTVELEQELPSLVSAERFSKDLVMALAARTASQVGVLAVGDVAPAAPIKRPAQLFGGLIALYVMLVLVAPGALKRAAQTLLRPGPLTAEEAGEPIVGDLTLTLVYPKYSGLQPKVVPSTSGDITALRGTEIRIETRALVPAKQASLVVGDDQVNAAKLDNGQITTKFIADKASTYRFVLGLPGGRQLREPIAHKIDLDPDRAPRVDLFAPSEDLEVSGPKIVEVGYAAEDDYGLSEVQLVWQAQGGAEQRKVLRAGIGTRSAQGRFDWDLAEVGLRPGMRVAYRIEARDNDDVGGPNVGSSRTFYLRLTSAREKHEARVERQAELLELLLRNLGDRLELAGVTGFPLVDRITHAHEGEQQAVTLAAQLADDIKGDSMAPKELRPVLTGMAERISKLLRDEEEPLTAARHHREFRETALREHSQKHVGELEQDVLKLDDLIGRQRLEDVAALADEASQARDRLKQLLEKYKKTRDEATRRELEREMRELAQRLREIQQKLAELAAKKEVPDEFLNAKMDKNALADLEKLEDMIRKGDVEAAARELEKLSRALDDMREALNQDMKGFRDQRFAAEEKAMSEMMDKVADLEQEEQKLRNETRGVLDRQREKAQQMMKDKIDQFVKKELEKVQRLQKRAQEVPQDPLAAFDQDELDRARRRIEDLKKTLDQGDLEQALEMARQAQRSLKSVQEDAKEDARRMSMSQRMRQDLDSAQKKLGEAEPVAKEIVDDLEKTMPSPQEMMSSEDRKRMQELGAKQREVRQQLDKLMQQARDKAKEAPGLGEMEQPLRGAGEDMQKAEGSLRGQQPREAFGSEQQAGEKLSELRKQMQRQRRPNPSGSEGRDVATEKIKIPGADEFRAPKEFRQDILEAMKEAARAPESYRNQVKKYYEELVK